MVYSIWKSRKFLTLCADALFSLVVLGLTTFLAPDKANFALAVVGIIQPVVIAVVAMWGIEDAAAKRAGIWPPGEVLTDEDRAALTEHYLREAN